MDGRLVKPSARRTATGIVLVEMAAEPFWAYYDEAEQIDRLIAFLNPLGSKEARLGVRLSQYRDIIVEGLISFPHGKIQNPEQISPEYTDEGSDDSDMPVVTIRRTAKRRTLEEPAYLRYRNTLKGR